jgi:hypothetical protein
MEGVTKLVCAKCGIIGKNADFQFLFEKCVFLEDAKSLEIQEIFLPSTMQEANYYNFYKVCCGWDLKFFLVPGENHMHWIAPSEKY